MSVESDFFLSLREYHCEYPRIDQNWSRLHKHELFQLYQIYKKKKKLPAFGISMLKLGSLGYIAKGSLNFSSSSRKNDVVRPRWIPTFEMIVAVRIFKFAFQNAIDSTNKGAFTPDSLTGPDSGSPTSLFRPPEGIFFFLYGFILNHRWVYFELWIYFELWVYFEILSMGLF